MCSGLSLTRWAFNNTLWVAAATCARDRRALHQLALNVHAKHSDLMRDAIPVRTSPLGDDIATEQSGSGRCTILPSFMSLKTFLSSSLQRERDVAQR